MAEHITVNEQSSVRIEAERVLYFDPFHISGEPRDADIILITHEHFDHFSPKDIAAVSKDDTVIIAPKAMANAGFPKSRAIFMAPGEVTEILGIRIEAVPAYNLLKPFHPKRNGWLGYVADIGGERVYVCGDTDDTPEARNVKCDIVCVPIGGTYTMNAKKAAAFVNELSPRAAIPIHYGTIVGKPSDAEEFERNVESSIRVIKKIRF